MSPFIQYISISEGCLVIQKPYLGCDSGKQINHRPVYVYVMPFGTIIRKLRFLPTTTIGKATQFHTLWMLL